MAVILVRKQNKSLLAIVLFLCAASLQARAQPARSFYPLSAGDYWIYWDYAWGAPGVWDTITATVAGDSMISDERYFVIITKSARYGNTSSSYERIDSTGDVLFLEPSTQQETLKYRLSDTSSTWWIGRGELQRFDSCVTRHAFGANRSLLYVGSYTVNEPAYDTSLANTRVLIDSIGFDYIVPNGIVDGGPTILVGGKVGGVSFGIVSGVDQGEPMHQPLHFRVTEPFPNPFNPTTHLLYTIPKRSHVTIEIINLLGRSVAVLLDTELDPGAYTVTWDASECSSGIYFCQLRANEFMATRRLLFVK